MRSQRVERPEVRALVFATQTVERGAGQMFCSTERAWELWQEEPLRRLMRWQRARVLWVIVGDDAFATSPVMPAQTFRLRFRLHGRNQPWCFYPADNASLPDVDTARQCADAILSVPTVRQVEIVDATGETYWSGTSA